jgi:cytochrome c-type biogenesis protein CcsB
LSDGLFTTAIAVYALAMVGYTAEYAFGRVARKSAAVAVPAAELVGAGGPPAVDAPAADIPTSKQGGRPRNGRWAERIGRWSVVITVLGALVHAGSIAVRAVAVDAVPWSNMYEFASVAGLVGILAFLAVLWKLPTLRYLGGFVLLPVILMMFLAGTVLYSKAQPLVPALQSYWLAIHVTLVSIAEGALMTSAVLTVLYLVKSRYNASKMKSERLFNLASKLPAAETLDKAAYRVVAFAFPLYTIAIICGAIWAEAAWGRYWGWDPKETWAFIVWVVYAGYLHARATAGWKGRAAAWINLVGFGSITFNFLIVNIVVSGLHSYAGLS